MDGLMWPLQGGPSIRADSFLLELLLAAVLPHILTRFYRLTSSLPRWLSYVLLHHVLHREVVTGPLAPRERPAVLRAIHNDRLVGILLEYVQHCMTQRKAAEKEKNKQKRKKDEERDAVDTGVTAAELPYAELVLLPASVVGEEEDDSPLGTHTAHGRRRNTSSSGGRYGMQQNMFWSRKGQRAAQCHPRRRHPNNNNRGSAAAAASQSLYTTLEHSYRVATLPVADAAMEVEPGLLVHHLRSAMRWHAYVATEANAGNEGDEDGRASDEGVRDAYRGRAGRRAGQPRQSCRRAHAQTLMRQRHNKREIRLFRDLLAGLRERHLSGAAADRRFNLERMEWNQHHLSWVLHNRLADGCCLDFDGAGMMGGNEGRTREEDQSEEDDDDEDGSGGILTFWAQLRGGQRRARRPHYKSDVVRPQIIIECYEVQPALVTRMWQRLRRCIAFCSTPRDSSSSNSSKEEDTDSEERRKRSRIDAFVERAVTWYAAMEAAAAERKASNERYLVFPVIAPAYTPAMPQAAAGGGDDDILHNGGETGQGHEADAPRARHCDAQERKMPHVRRYLLPAHGGKDFDSLFFSQKARVLQILDQFAHRRGKFAIPGVPRRLTWLLYGPPGTGKTSLLRAMARRLKRHVLVLPLLALRQRTMLREWLHEQNVICDNGHESHAGGDEKGMSCRSDTKDEAEVRFRLCPSQVIYLIEDIDAILDHTNTTNSNTSRRGAESLAHVDVYSVLHTLGDATAASGRIVVLSTNHLERVQGILADKGIQTEKIHLSYMNEACAAQMLAYYFQTTLDAGQRNKLHDCFASHTANVVSDEDTTRHAIAPAWLEQLCMTCESVDAVLDSLRRPRCDAESIVGRDMF